MQNGEKWDDIFYADAEEARGSDTEQAVHFPEEMEDDVEVFFMMMFGLG